MALTLSAVMVGTVLQTAAASATIPTTPTAGRDLPGLPSAEKPVKGKDIRTGEPRATAKGPKTPQGTPKAAWPKEGAALVSVTGADSSNRAATDKTPVRFTTRTAARETPAARVLGHTAAQRAGVDGVLFTLEGAGTVDARLDYSSFAQAYGGGYGSRLTLVELPACALDKPDKTECRTATPVETVNDTERQTLTAPKVALRSSGPTLFAAVAAADETAGKGDYTATQLSPSATWDTDLNTGDFSWSYDIPVPEVPGGLAPDLGLSYQSGRIDGQTATTNNQSSWVGDGFDLWSGFIERRYKPCSDDGVKNADGDKPGDLCWGYDNAFITFNGKGGELVPTGEDDFRFKQDDGSRIKRLRSTDRGNGDDNGEYWRLTDPNGVRYYFGYNRLPGWAAGKETTDSTWTVPVFGDDSGEPCHKTAFADSWCQQAWRWNLDYVEDPHGNAVAYYYDQEKNSYGRNLKAKDNTRYVRGGSLDRVEYGLKSTDLYGTKPLGKVDFTTSERCLPDSKTTCTDIGKDAFHWYDTPWDLNCEAGKDCDQGRLSPVFFTRKRLTGITTEVLKGDAPAKVDSWKLDHRWGKADVDYQLLLDSIQHTGHSATPAITLPKTTFGYTQLANRLDRTGDGYAPFIKSRLSTVADEYGGQVDINYSAPACSFGSLPTPEKNTTRCYPQFIGGDADDAPERQWFNKYVVTSTMKTDRTGGAPDSVTQYEYLGDAAWHYDDDDGLTKQKHKTWSQWRGYGHVRVKTGGQGGAMKSQQDTYFLRGMDGDRESGSGGTKKVSVSLDSGEGDPITDHESAAGFAYKTVAFSGVGGKVLSKSVSRPWHHETAKKSRDWGTLTANLTGTARSQSWTSLDAGAGSSWASTATESTHDTVAGRVIRVDDLGDTGTAADDRCTRTTYAPGDLLTLVAREETVLGACSRTPNRAKDVVSDVRTAYDGGAYGAAATKGEATASATLKSHDGSTATYLESKATFDSYGRQLTTTDLTADIKITGTGEPVRTARKDGRTTTTVYSPASGFPTKVTETTPPAKPGVASTAQTTVTEFEALRGRPTAQVDPNNKRAEFMYDALGRSHKIWLPDRRTSQTPSHEFTYFIDENKPAAIRTQTLDNNGGQRASYVLYDGFLRERQTQEPGPEGGRILTDVFYDERGLTGRTFAPYFNDQAAPNRDLFKPADALTVETQTWHTYDGLGRETETRDVAGNGDGGAVLGITRTLYGGDRTTVIPPEGSTATTAIANARGLVTELRQHRARSADAAYDTTKYGYTLKGELEKVTDPAGNTWGYEYDQRGRETRTEDPDRGTTIRDYDDRGLLTTTKDAHGTVLAHLYDGLDRRTELREGSDTGTLRAKWTYDTVSGAKGFLAEATRYIGGDAYTSKVTQYDRLYRPMRTAVVVPEREGALAGTYETGTAYLPSGLVQGVSWSAAGALPGGGYSFTYEPDTLRPVSVLGDGFKAETGYSKTGKPLQHKMYGTAAGAKPVQVTNTYEWGTQRLATSRVDRQDVAGVDRHNSYRYDQSGNILSVSDTSRSGTDTQCFGYDHLQRLTQAWTQGDKTCAAAPSGAAVGGPAPYWQSYTYDKTGNRLTETLHDPSGDSAKDTERTYDYPTPGSAHPHGLDSVTTRRPDGTTTKESYDYDATGNTTTRGGQELDWDAEGHLEKVTEGGKTTEYVYGADGSRLISRTGSATTLYLGHTEVTLAKGAEKPKATRYTPLGGGHQAVKSDDGAVTFTLADHQGTGQLAVDAATQQLTQRRMLPFGGIRGAAPKAWVGSRGFVGGTDETSDTGLVHLGAREYDPTTGRFLSVDPIMDLTDPQQLNGYAYAENSPITFSDSNGQWKWWDNTVKKAKQVGSGIKNGAIDGYYDIAEGAYTFTDRMGWTSGNAQKIKNDRAGKGLVSVYNTIRGPDQGGAWYKISYWIGKFLVPFLPGASGVGGGAKAASKPGSVAKVVKGVLGNLFSGAAKKSAPPKAAPPRIVPRPDVSTRGVGGKSAPAVEIQKAPTGWTQESRMQDASSQVADFALKHASKKKANKTYVGGYHIDSGDIALAQSGGCKPGPSYCAEGNVVRALGGDPAKVRFTVAYTVKFNQGTRVPEMKPVCTDCQLDYPSPSQFEPGAVPAPGGIWERQGH